MSQSGADEVIACKENRAKISELISNSTGQWGGSEAANPLPEGEEISRESEGISYLDRRPSPCSANKDPWTRLSITSPAC